MRIFGFWSNGSIIIGLAKAEAAPADRRLFSYADIRGDPAETKHKAIAPYLFDAGSVSDPHLVVKEESHPINGLPKLLSGSQPIDKGHYIFDVEQRRDFLASEPDAEQFLRPFMGAQEFLNGGHRWILSLQKASPSDLRKLPHVLEKMRAVSDYRHKSKRKQTLEIADYPARYNVEVIPTGPFLVIPEVSSERREYVPIGWLEPPTIPSNLVRVLENASRGDFALLTSAMHMAWLRNVGGRLESRYRYSIGLVYNTFPLPPVPAEDMERVLTPHADAVLAARANHTQATLADLYDPLTMPQDLRRAHTALDRAVDRLYRPKGFASERERVEHLFMLYERLQAPLAAATAAKPQRKRRKKTAKAAGGPG